ncbi:hypothetical protein LMG7974_01391 [Campylobacter majalis]|uniref:Uncharacterized protein n=1 Tax=Campylobacter majalis TaxID=2790656 RepID=A0ABM8Q8A9_9BACT|nr:hypothetical protein [Campylobacter majalis]CAD7289191.1 hypothetical protein LMG7974_01391 [Campylobacter majalis]
MGSFGAISKSKIYTHFHLLCQNLKNKSNFKISNLLSISKSRVKNLKLNAHLPYNPKDNKSKS